MAFALLHKAVGDSAGANGNQAVTITSTTAGSLTVVKACCGGDVHTSMTIADNGGTHATWVAIVGPTYDATLNKTYAVWASYNTPAAITVVTVTYGSSQSPRGTLVSEWSGADGTEVVDKNAVVTGTSTTPQTTAVTPSAASELVMGWCLGASTIPVNGGGIFTGENGNNNALTEANFVIQTTAVSVQPNWTCASQYFVAIVLTFPLSALGGTVYQNSVSDAVAVADAIDLVIVGQDGPAETVGVGDAYAYVYINGGGGVLGKRIARDNRPPHGTRGARR